VRRQLVLVHLAVEFDAAVLQQRASMSEALAFPVTRRGPLPKLTAPEVSIEPKRTCVVSSPNEASEPLAVWVFIAPPKLTVFTVLRAASCIVPVRRFGSSSTLMPTLHSPTFGPFATCARGPDSAPLAVFSAVRRLLNP
jgi:hypothetical protein